MVGLAKEVIILGVASILNVISGSYAFLVTAQVLVICGLLLAFIWLMIQRARDVVPHEAAPPEAPKVESPVVEAAPTPPPPAPAPVVQEVVRTADPAEVTELNDKIRYLESRLMEYEIVQEEISSLGTLRDENEQLKKELFEIKKASQLNASAPSAPAAPAQALNDAPSAPPDASAAAAQAPHSEDPESAVQLDTILKKLDEIAPKQ